MASNWVHVRSPCAVSSASLPASDVLAANRTVMLDSTEYCTIKDLSLHYHVQRLAPAYAKIFFMIVPDDMVTALNSADLTDTAVVAKYEDFIWLEHSFYFGIEATSGHKDYNLDLKTGTMRSLGPNEKLILCIEFEDITNQTVSYADAWAFDYYYLPKGNTP